MPRSRCPRRPCRDVLAAEQIRPPRRQEAGDQVQQGGLAATGRADHRAVRRPDARSMSLDAAVPGMVNERFSPRRSCRSPARPRPRRTDELARPAARRWRAGKPGRAVESLQQHHRIGSREKAGDQIGELEFADRQRRTVIRPARLWRRRQNDAEEALKAGAERLRRPLQRSGRAGPCRQQPCEDVGQRSTTWPATSSQRCPATAGCRTKRPA